MSRSYDLQYRMELANQGMFFDDEEVAAMRGCGCCARARARLTLRRRCGSTRLPAIPPVVCAFSCLHFPRAALLWLPSGSYVVVRGVTVHMLERARHAKITAVEGSRPGLLRFVFLFCSVPVPVPVGFIFDCRGLCEPLFFLMLTRVRAATVTASRGRRSFRMVTQESLKRRTRCSR